MSSRTFALMFEVEDGGISNPVHWSKESLKSENIVMILDESNMAVWLWFGAKRGLVSKRTALRQAQSLKGHGYTLGKSIVGRGLDKIYEIDERKIGRDPETDELNSKFMELLSKPVNDAGGFVVTFGGPGEPLPVEEHFEPPKPIEMEAVQPKVSAEINPVPSPTPTEINPVPSPTPTEINPVPSPAPAEINPVPSPAPTTTESPVVASEYADDVVIPEPTPISTVTSEEIELAQKGCVIMAILSQFKDIWVSRIDENTISIEYMDGPIAKFHIEEGKVKFHEGSFSEIEVGTKNAIKQVFDSLISVIK